MKKDGSKKREDEKIVLDGEFNDRFEQMRHQVRMERAAANRKK